MAHPEIDMLANRMLSIAEEQLRKRTVLAPFAMVMVRNEFALKYAAADSAAECLHLLREGLIFEATKTKLEAVGVCFDALYRPSPDAQQQDAVCVELEHHTGESAKIFRPYRRTLFRRLVLGDLVRAPYRPQILRSTGSGN